MEHFSRNCWSCVRKNGIDKQIQEQETLKWNTFVSTPNHSTTSTKIYNTLNSIARSSTNTVTSHATITNNDRLPTHTEQANKLINHYSIDQTSKTYKTRQANQTQEQRNTTGSPSSTIHSKTNATHSKQHYKHL